MGNPVGTVVKRGLGIKLMAPSFCFLVDFRNLQLTQQCLQMGIREAAQGQPWSKSVLPGRLFKGGVGCGGIQQVFEKRFGNHQLVSVQ